MNERPPHYDFDYSLAVLRTSSRATAYADYLLLVRSISGQNAAPFSVLVLAGGGHSELAEIGMRFMETNCLLSIAHLDFLLGDVLVRHRDPVWGPEGSASRDD